MTLAWSAEATHRRLGHGVDVVGCAARDHEPGSMVAADREHPPHVGATTTPTAF